MYKIYVSSFLCWCSVGAQTLFVHFMLLWFCERLFSAFFSLISLHSNILPQRDATLSDGCLFGGGAGNWARHFKDSSAFVTENCLCDHNADILWIRIFVKLSKRSNCTTTSDIIFRCIHPIFLINCLHLSLYLVLLVCWYSRSGWHTPPVPRLLHCSILYLVTLY